MTGVTYALVMCVFKMAFVAAIVTFWLRVQYIDKSKSLECHVRSQCVFGSFLCFSISPSPHGVIGIWYIYFWILFIIHEWTTA